MELRTLKALLEDQLKDLYSAENQLVKALPKMARRASSSALRSAFEQHIEETKEHVTRLRDLGKSLGITLGGKKCHAMEGLIEEGEEVLEAEGEDVIIDAALIAAAQRTEHYEISGYGTARAMAEHLGLDEAVQTLQRTLDEESATDEKLSSISVGELLPAALRGQDEMEEPAGRRAVPSRGGANKSRGSAPSSRSASTSSRSGSSARATASAGRGGGGQQKKPASRTGGSRGGRTTSRGKR